MLCPMSFSLKAAWAPEAPPPMITTSLVITRCVVVVVVVAAAAAAAPSALGKYTPCSEKEESRRTNGDIALVRAMLNIVATDD